jgi:hypothetical protein
MSKTLISDVVIPEIFVPYVIQRTAEKSALFTSGIISQLTGLNLGNGGQKVSLPFWNDLTGDDEVLSDTTPLTPAKFTTGEDSAVLLTRGKAFSANDLAGSLAGSDPLRALGDMVANYWVRQQNKTLVNILSGAFSAANATNVHDISALAGTAANISGKSFVDAAQKLGDAKDRLVAVIMHSATEAQLAKNDLIQYFKDSQGSVIVKTFMDKIVLTDDSLPVAGDVYTTYLFGEGAVGYAEGSPKVPVEVDRDSLAGDDILISRRHYILHPRGIAYQGAQMRPDNATLADGNNWSQVYDGKNIRIVKFVHKLDQV